MVGTPRLRRPRPRSSGRNSCEPRGSKARVAPLLRGAGQRKRAVPTQIRTRPNFPINAGNITRKKPTIPLPCFHPQVAGRLLVPGTLMGLFDSLRRVVRPKTEPGKPAAAPPPSKSAVEETPAPESAAPKSPESATPKLQESATSKSATSNTTQLTSPSAGKLTAIEPNPPAIDP